MIQQRMILVAGDEPHVISAVSSKLCNAGYRVVTAGDGQEALDAAVTDRPDLLIADYQMPRLSGVELCQRLRQAGANIPAILLTAPGYDVKPSDPEKSGIRCMLSKPFIPRHLLAMVRKVLGAATITPAAA